MIGSRKSFNVMHKQTLQTDQTSLRASGLVTSLCISFICLMENRLKNAKVEMVCDPSNYCLTE